MIVGLPPYRVLINPAPNVLVRFLSGEWGGTAKGGVERDGRRLYVWQARRATHRMGEEHLSLAGLEPIPFVIGFNEDNAVALDVIADTSADNALARPHPTLRTFRAIPEEAFPRRWV